MTCRRSVLLVGIWWLVGGSVFAQPKSVGTQSSRIRWEEKGYTLTQMLGRLSGESEQSRHNALGRMALPLV